MKDKTELRLIYIAVRTAHLLRIPVLPLEAYLDSSNSTGCKVFKNCVIINFDNIHFINTSERF